MIFAVLGAGGQTIYNMAEAGHSTVGRSASRAENGKGWLDSKWSPVKVLSDSEYERMLQEKLLRVEAEIAMVDESLEELKNQDK